jgi:hypothetical protein
MSLKCIKKGKYTFSWINFKVKHPLIYGWREYDVKVTWIIHVGASTFFSKMGTLLLAQ